MRIRHSFIRSPRASRSAGGRCGPRSTRRTRTIPTKWPGCRPGRSPTPAQQASPQCSIRPRPRRFTLSPTAPEDTCSQTRWRSTMPMLPDGLRSAARAGRCDGLSEILGSHVPDAARFACIAPRPAEAVVEQVEALAYLQLTNGVAALVRRTAQDRRCGDFAFDRLRVMRGDDPVHERNVGEILAEGVVAGGRWIRRAGEHETPSAGARRLAPGR